MHRNKTAMDLTEGSQGIYEALKLLLNSPLYEQTLQACWDFCSYKAQIVVLAEMLRLQQNKLLSDEVTAEDMIELLVEKSKNTLRVKLWEYDVENFAETDVRPLLRMVWEVNTSMKMRDVEFEARRLLDSPDTMPPKFNRYIQHAEVYARTLTERQQEAHSSKHLSPREVVMEVVPKVLQGFWFPPSSASFNMPSQHLSKMTVAVTKAVEDQVCAAVSSTVLPVAFSCSIRDITALLIQEKVGLIYPEDILQTSLDCFAAEILNTIVDVAAEKICEFFPPSEDDCSQPTDSTNTAEPLASPDVQNDWRNGLDEAEEQATPGPEPDSGVVPAPRRKKGLTYVLWKWFQKTFSCWGLPENMD